jgi:hypothetical protein
MIEKIIAISNIRHVIDFKFYPSELWNGELGRVNVIYTPNGSENAILSTILKSLALDNPELIDFKNKSNSDENPEITIKGSENESLIKFNGENWSQNNLDINVFDVNYFEEYFFEGSHPKLQSRVNLYKWLLEEEGINFKNELKEFFSKRKRLDFFLSKKNASDDIAFDEYKEEYNSIITKIELKRKQCIEYSRPIFKKYIDTVNKYLEGFTSYLKVLDIYFQYSSGEYELFQVVPIFDFYGEEIVYSEHYPNIKFTDARSALTEADKITIALCFFLAKLEIQGIGNKIVVFDNFLSSFDYSRRNAAIIQLSRIATSAAQFFLLTHDLTFANDFSETCTFLKPINLKIENNGKTTTLYYHNILTEYLTGTQKAITIIREFLDNPPSDEHERKEVVRSIRLVIEAVIKTKYFDLLDNSKRLGEIIDLVKSSSCPFRLKKFQLFIKDLIELNECYHKYHYSSLGSAAEDIDPMELQSCVNLLMKTIDRV